MPLLMMPQQKMPAQRMLLLRKPAQTMPLQRMRNPNKLIEKQTDRCGTVSVCFLFMARHLY
jgi:hypothetical protein